MIMQAQKPPQPFPAKKVHPYTTICAPYLSSTWPYATPFVELNQLALKRTCPFSKFIAVKNLRFSDAGRSDEVFEHTGQKYSSIQSRMN